MSTTDMQTLLFIDSWIVIIIVYVMLALQRNRIKWSAINVMLRGNKAIRTI